jgi:Kef-type K+ transport system membrane component KefB
MVSKLTSAEILSFLIIITVILVAGRGLGEVCRKLKLPVVVGEVLAGIIIGPSLFGSLFPNLFKNIFLSQPRAYGAFDGLANVGIILLMFSAGIEVDLKQIRAFGKQAAYISITGLLFPFAVGFITVCFFYDRLFSTPSDNHLVPALFVGTALSITALSVIAKVLIDIDILKTKVGNLVLTAAMIDDFLGWVLFSVIITLMNKGNSTEAYSSVGYVLLFVAFIMTIGKWGVNKLLQFTDKHLSMPGGAITVGVCLCFIAAVVTEWLGVRGIFGAFLMGIAVGDSKYFQERSQRILQQFAVNIAAPLFFASIGLRINFVTNFNLEVVVIILAIASIAKLAGAVIGCRLSGMRSNESYAVAFGMNARGSQELVLGLLALQAKIIDEQIFVGLVVMTIVSILIAGPMMRFFLNKDVAAEAKIKPAAPPVKNKVVSEVVV